MKLGNKRLASLMLKELSLLQLDAKDEYLKKVSFTGIDLAPDLSTARVYVTGNDLDLDRLNKSSSFFRRNLSKKLDIRKMPEINFAIDKAVIEGAKIDQIIKDINK